MTEHPTVPAQDTVAGAKLGDLHPHWSAENRNENYPKTLEEWDPHKDPVGQHLERAVARIRVSMDRDDPRAPAEMTIISRWDLTTLVHDWWHKCAGFEMWREARAGDDPQFKLVYIKRWRTLFKVPVSIADEVRAALNAEPPAGPTQGSAAGDPVAWRWRWNTNIRRDKNIGDDWTYSDLPTHYYKPGELEIEPLYASASRSPAGCGTPGCTDPNCNYANEPAPDWKQDQADTSVMPRGPLPAECSGQVSERELHDFIMDDARGPLARAILQKYRLEPK